MSRSRSGPDVERVSVTQLKGSLSANLAKVKAGKTLVIIDRGIAVAVFSPVSWDWENDPMRDLVLSGQVTPPSGELPEEFFEGPTVEDSGGLLRAFLTEERD